MNRFSTLLFIGLVAGMAGCGSSVTSSTQAPTNDLYSVAVTPDRLTLNAGDWSSISAVVDVSNLNSTPRPVTPVPSIKYFSSDPRVTVSPTGVVCAGQWDPKYLVCATPATLPVGAVTVTASDLAHNVSGSTQVFVHTRATNINLSAPVYSGPVTVSTVNGVPNQSSIPLGQYPAATNCVSQNNLLFMPTVAGNLPPNGTWVNNSQVRYKAKATDVNGVTIPNCSDSLISGCINDNDYTWTVLDSNVAAASLYGDIVARNPGVTSVYATLNGTVSAPLAFATCPPASIVLASSGYTKGAPTPPYSTADLDNLNKGSLEYLTAQSYDKNGNPMAPTDANGQPLSSLQLSFISSDVLTGAFTTIQPLTSQFTANSSGRTSLMVSCAPPNCNNSVANFVSPSGQQVTAASVGYGYPIYSNIIGATVTGTTASTVLMTGQYYADGKTLAHQLLTYDTESLALTHTIELANTPNSLVVSPNGAKAYVGSSAGLMVIDLGAYQSTLQAFPIIGDPINTDVITGAVIGVSPDSRYVVLSNPVPNSDNGVPNSGLVYLIDTTGTKAAARYTIPGIRTVTFAADGSNFWIAGDSGVYIYQGDAFIQTLTNASTSVTALAWAADGQSYLASGSQLVDYSTCNDKFLQTLGAGPVNLSSTAINGVPRVFGFAGTKWLDYSVTSSSQIGSNPLVGNVCLSTVKVNDPATPPSTLSCPATQFSFSPRLEQEFITGVNSSCATPEPVIHAYDLTTQAEFTLGVSPTGTSTYTPAAILPLSGGVLNDGRKLYIGTMDSKNGALLRRFDLATQTEDVVTTQQEVLNPLTGQPTTTPPTYATVTTIPASVPLIPSFVAVVPK